MYAVAALTVAGGLCLPACGDPTQVPEDGALLLRATVPKAGPAPQELRAFVYDDNGVVFHDVRFPAGGDLPAARGGNATRAELGTILLQPGDATGDLRIHLRGLIAGLRVLDGIAVAAAGTRNKTTIEVALSAEVPTDDDADDVPDVIDDCPPQSNPDQGGCPDAGTADGSADGMSPGDDGGDGGNGASDGGAEVDGGADGGVGDAGSGVDAGPDVADDAAAGDATPSTDATDSEVVGVDANTTDTAGSDTAPADAGVSDGSPTDAMTRDATTSDAGAADVTHKSLGSSCGVATECSSGFCADKICCQTACDQPCERCLFGSCVPVTRTQDTPECAGNMSCNSRGNCVSN